MNSKKGKSKKFNLIIFPLVVVLTSFAACFIVRCSIKDSGERKYADKIIECAREFSLEPSLVFAVIKAESGFNENAVSEKGACGLMQLMPETAGFIAEKLEFKGEINLFSASCNIYLGCGYLKYLFEKFGEERCALCAYNAGEGRVSGWLADENYSADGKTLFRVPFSQTRNYVEKVERYKQKFDKKYKKYKRARRLKSKAVARPKCFYRNKKCGRLNE